MKYSFCPKCGGSLSSVDHHGGKEMECAKCGFVFYQNAKPTASVLLENEKGEVLLTRRAVEPFKGAWDLAGGFCKEDEHPEVGAKREIKEELGVDIELKGLVGMFMDTYGENGGWTLNIVYTGKIISGKIVPADDIDGYEWFSLDHLPKVAFSNGNQALDMFRQMKFS